MTALGREVDGDPHPDGATIVVRRASEADLPATTALFRDLEVHQRAWRVFEPRPGFDGEVRDRYRRALEDPRFLHLVAEEDGRVVGMGVGEVVRPSIASDDEALEISNVVVLDSHRGRGIARTLVAALAAFGRDRGVTRGIIKVFAPNDGALTFWRRLGFEPRAVELTAQLGSLAGGSSGSPATRPAP